MNQRSPLRWVMVLMSYLPVATNYSVALRPGCYWEPKPYWPNWPVIPWPERFVLISLLWPHLKPRSMDRPPRYTLPYMPIRQGYTNEAAGSPMRSEPTSFVTRDESVAAVGPAYHLQVGPFNYRRNSPGHYVLVGRQFCRALSKATFWSVCAVGWKPMECVSWKGSMLLTRRLAGGRTVRHCHCRARGSWQIRSGPRSDRNYNRPLGDRTPARVNH